MNPFPRITQREAQSDTAQRQPQQGQAARRGRSAGNGRPVSGDRTQRPAGRGWLPRAVGGRGRTVRVGRTEPRGTPPVPGTSVRLPALPGRRGPAGRRAGAAFSPGKPGVGRCGGAGRPAAAHPDTTPAPTRTAGASSPCGSVVRRGGPGRWLPRRRSGRRHPTAAARDPGRGGDATRRKSWLAVRITDAGADGRRFPDLAPVWLVGRRGAHQVAAAPDRDDQRPPQCACRGVDADSRHGPADIDMDRAGTIAHRTSRRA